MLSGCCAGKLNLCISIHCVQSFLKMLVHLGSCLSFDTGALLFVQPLPSFGLDVGHKACVMSNHEQTLSAASGAAATEHLPVSHVFSSSAALGFEQLRALTFSVRWRTGFKHQEQTIHLWARGRAAVELPLVSPVAVFDS